MTPLEAFILGTIWGTFRQLPEGFAVDRPTVDGAPTLVVHGKQTGTEVLITITETRGGMRDDAPALRYQYDACHADKAEWREIAENLAYDLRIALRVLTGKQEAYSLDSFDEALAAFDRKVAES